MKRAKEMQEKEKYINTKRKAREEQITRKKIKKVKKVD